MKVSCTGCRLKFHKRIGKWEHGGWMWASHVTNSKRFKLPNDFVYGGMLVFVSLAFAPVNFDSEWQQHRPHSLLVCEAWSKGAPTKEVPCCYLLNTVVRVQSAEERCMQLSVRTPQLQNTDSICRTRLLVCPRISMTWLASGWKREQMSLWNRRNWSLSVSEKMSDWKELSTRWTDVPCHPWMSPQPAPGEHALDVHDGQLFLLCDPPKLNWEGREKAN